MKTTVELPADLLRRLKAAAALQGRTLKDLMIEALREKLQQRRDQPTGWRAVLGKAPKGAVRDVDARVRDLEMVNPDDWR